MAEFIYFSGANNNCSKYSANKISKSRILFTVLFLFCVFFFGNAKVFSQLQIVDQATWNQFVLEVENNLSAGQIYELMVDVGIGDPSSPDFIDTVRSPIGGVFRGNFNGGNNRIIVNITDDSTNVGLFRFVEGGQIDSLTLEGYVVGGSSTRTLGAFAGRVIGGSFYHCKNLASVTGDNRFDTLFIGGIAGYVGFLASPMKPIYASDNILKYCENNGFLSNGSDIGGIIGVAGLCRTVVSISYSNNSGTLQNATNSAGGILGRVRYCCRFITVEGVVNIGNILTCDASYVGGLAGYFSTDGENPSRITASKNSGLVAGATIAVGGLVGYLGAGIPNVSAEITRSINTNWVDSGAATHFGAIVGYNNGRVDSCYYDKQMCILGGINNRDSIDVAEGKYTVEMTNNSLMSC